MYLKEKKSTKSLVAIVLLICAFTTSACKKERLNDQVPILLFDTISYLECCSNDTANDYLWYGLPYGWYNGNDFYTLSDGYTTNNTVYREMILSRSAQALLPDLPIENMKFYWLPGGEALVLCQDKTEKTVSFDVEVILKTSRAMYFLSTGHEIKSIRLLEKDNMTLEDYLSDTITILNAEDSLYSFRYGVGKQYLFEVKEGDNLATLFPDTAKINWQVVADRCRISITRGKDKFYALINIGDKIDVAAGFVYDAEGHLKF